MRRGPPHFTLLRSNTFRLSWIKGLGRRVRLPDAEESTYYVHEPYARKHVTVPGRYDHEGNLAYRVQLAEDGGGPDKAEEDLEKVAPPEEVEFVDETSGADSGDRASGDGGDQ